MDVKKFLGNVVRWKLGLALAGSAGWWAYGGKLYALAFCAGALASAASFWFLKGLVTALGTEKPGAGVAWGGPLRLVVIGYLLFVIIENYRLPLPALVTGLLVAIAAISIDVIREHFYA